MRVKARLAMLFFLALVSMAVFFPAVPAEAAQTVRVGVYENSPKIFADEDGRASGFWGDVLDYIAAEEGWQVDYVAGSWTECLARLQSNEIDLMPDVAFTENRSALYDFSTQAVYVSWSRVYARDGVNIESVLDLEGKTVAVLRGSVNVEGPEGIKKLVSAFGVTCSFLETDSYTGVFEMMDRGEADAGVVSKDFGYLHQAGHGVAETAIIFQPSSLYFAFTRGAPLTPSLIEAVDRRVREMKADQDSVYYQSLEDWLGIRPSGSEREVVPAWVVWTIAGVLSLALVLAAVGLVQRRQVQARTRALREETTERKRYEEMDKLKSDLLSMVSHELRTPLATIKGYSSMLLDYSDRLESEEKTRSLQSIDQATDRLVGLVDQLLEMSRMDAGLLRLEKDLVDPAALIQQTIEEARLRRPDQRLEADVPEGLPPVRLDVDRIRQVLDNLIDNAVKYGSSDQGVTVSVRQDDGRLVFGVADRGPGIPPGELEAIFGRMYRIEKRPGGKAVHGLGLGLPICRGLVEAHGGRIWAESPPGQGSRFYFTIPLEDKEVPAHDDESDQGSRR